MQSLTISLKIYDFIIYSVLAPFPWFVPSCFTQNKHGHELRGHWDPPLRQPQVEAGRVSSWEDGAGSRSWQPLRCGVLTGVAGFLLGQISVVCELEGTLPRGG